MDLLYKLNSLRGELEKNNLIELLDFQIEKPIKHFYYKHIKRELGYDAELKLGPIYNQANGFKIFWKYKQNDGWMMPGGEINISHMLNLLSTNNSKLSEQFAYQDDWPDEVQSIVYPLRQFDIYQESVDGLEFVAIDLQSQKQETMWLWTLSAVNRYRLDLNLQNYLKWAFEAKGCLFWQYFFVDIERMDFEDTITRKYFASSFDDAIRRMEDCLKTMNTVFPDEEFAPFKERYENVKRLAK